MNPEMQMHVGERHATHALDDPVEEGEHVLIPAPRKVGLGNGIQPPACPSERSRSGNVLPLALGMQSYNVLNELNGHLEGEYAHAGCDGEPDGDVRAGPPREPTSVHGVSTAPARPRTWSLRGTSSPIAIQARSGHHGSAGAAQSLPEHHSHHGHGNQINAIKFLSPTRRAQMEERRRREHDRLSTPPTSVGPTPAASALKSPDTTQPSRHDAFLQRQRMFQHQAQESFRAPTDHTSHTAHSDHHLHRSSRIPTSPASTAGASVRDPILVAKRRAERAAFLAERHRVLAAAEGSRAALETVDFRYFEDPQLCPNSPDGRPHAVLCHRRAIFGWDDAVLEAAYIETDGRAETEKVDLSRIHFPPGDIFPGLVYSNFA